MYYTRQKNLNKKINKKDFKYSLECTLFFNRLSCNKTYQNWLNLLKYMIKLFLL